MRASKDEQIAGVPAADLRRVFRTMRGQIFVGVDELRAAVGEGLCLTAAQRKALVAQLITDGYIERSRNAYELSEQGLRLAAASTGKPILRAQAEALLAAFIERARLINQGDSWDRVAKIELFGSMLDPSRETVNDIDLMVTLTPRYCTTDSQELLQALSLYQRARTRNASGGLSRLLSFPSDEVFKQLKAGKRAYQLLDVGDHDEIRARTTCTVVYEDHAEPIPLPESLR